MARGLLTSPGHSAQGLRTLLATERAVVESGSNLVRISFESASNQVTTAEIP